MKTNRRELVKMAALAFAGAPVAAVAARGTLDVAALRAHLVQQRARIKTFRVRYTLAGDANDALNGPNEVLFDGSGYHIRHLGRGRPFFVIVTPQESVTALGEPARVQRARTKHWPPAPSIDHFLPVPFHLPMTLIGGDEIGGRSCVGLAQGEFRYWIDADRAAVLRRETYTKAGVVRLRETFSEFRDTDAAVAFPGFINIDIFDRSGAFIRRSLIVIDEVESNREFESSLFDIARYRTQ